MGRRGGWGKPELREALVELDLDVAGLLELDVLVFGLDRLAEGAE